MSTFVLVHGGWHGAWCWYKAVPLLEQAGHKVVTLDLPAHGIDETPVDGLTLHDNVDCVCEVVDRQEEPVILVGHSSGGAVITQTAEARPDAIDTLVYLSGFLLPDGASVMDIARADEDSLLGPNVIPNEEAGYATVQENALREALYHDCSETDLYLARSLLRPQPLGLLGVPVETTEQRFGSVRRVYIECLQDHATTPDTQTKMYTTLPCEEVLSLDTSHSPFFSTPEALVDRLIAV